MRRTLLGATTALRRCNLPYLTSSASSRPCALRSLGSDATPPGSPAVEGGAARGDAGEAAAAPKDESAAAVLSLHAALLRHSGLALEAVTQLVAHEPSLASSPEAVQAAAARCVRYAHVLPSFARTYPPHFVASMLAGGPKLMERLLERGPPPGVQAPPPAVVVYLADKRSPHDIGPVGDVTFTEEEPRAKPGPSSRLVRAMERFEAEQEAMYADESETAEGDEAARDMRGPAKAPRRPPRSHSPRRVRGSPPERSGGGAKPKRS